MRDPGNRIAACPPCSSPVVRSSSGVPAWQSRHGIAGLDAGTDVASRRRALSLTTLAPAGDRIALSYRAAHQVVSVTSGRAGLHSRASGVAGLRAGAPRRLSSQRLSVGTRHPVIGSQLSTVQPTTASSVTSGVPAWQSRHGIAGLDAGTDVVVVAETVASLTTWSPLPVIGSHVSYRAADHAVVRQSSGVPACTVELVASQVSVPVQTSLSSHRLSVARCATPGDRIAAVDRAAHPSEHQRSAEPLAVEHRIAGLRRRCTTSLSSHRLSVVDMSH